MAKVKLIEKVTLHNKHHLVLTDARTGKLKQEAWAYNIILTQGLTRLVINHFGAAHELKDEALRGVFGTTTANGWAGQTFVGTGTGEISAARTTMFNLLSRKNNSLFDSGMNTSEATAYHTRIAVWNENEIQNTSITEVGLGTDNDAYLVTHALIEDSEGNPITVAKGELDILTIYSTVYLELSSGYGSSLGFVGGTPPIGYDSQPGNFFLLWLKDNMQPSGIAHGDFPHHFMFTIVAGRSKDAIAYSDAAVKTAIETSYLNTININKNDSRLTFSGANKNIVIDAARIAANRQNHADGIWEIGVLMRRPWNISLPYAAKTYSAFRTLMPITSVWPGYDNEGEEIGTGDGVNKIFNTQWKPIVAESEAIYVDAVLQTKTTHYTINYTTGQVEFVTAPAEGLAVTADYSILFIPKDVNHVLDISFTIQFADGNV